MSHPADARDDSGESPTSVSSSGRARRGDPLCSSRSTFVGSGTWGEGGWRQTAGGRRHIRAEAVGSGTGRSKVSLPAATKEKIAECTLDAHGALQFQGRIWALQTSVDSMTNLPAQDESAPRYMMVIIDRLSKYVR
ncbi:hypothetical protein E4U52_006834 [Claviceps spartinae]|nr:hypothetical protein E4U52_006834 [Claviceps spartinae]